MRPTGLHPGRQQFRNAPSLARLLRFVVERSLAGDTAALKESVIGVEVFDRGSDFDPKADSIVRIQAGNLRNRLAKYYETPDAAGVIRIEIPKGAYVPVFVVRTPEPSAPPPRARPNRRSLAAVGLAALALLAALLFAALRHPSQPPDQISSIAVLPFEDFSPAHVPAPPWSRRPTVSTWKAATFRRRIRPNP